jgi:hypothetical protein
VIVTQPSSAAMTDTTPLLLSVQAAGSATLKFQWRKDEQAIPGETNTTFSLLTPRRTNSGSYSVSVTNTFGSVISADAKVRVVVPVQIGKPRISADGGVLISAADRDGAPLGPNDTPFFSAWASTNLIQWESLSGGLTVSNGLLWLHESGAPRDGWRFYRFGEILAW